MGLHEVKKLLHKKGNHQQQSEKAASRMEEISADYATDRGLTLRMSKELRSITTINSQKSN